MDSVRRIYDELNALRLAILEAEQTLHLRPWGAVPPTDDEIEAASVSHGTLVARFEETFDRLGAAIHQAAEPPRLSQIRHGRLVFQELVGEDGIREGDSGPHAEAVEASALLGSPHRVHVLLQYVNAADSVLGAEWTTYFELCRRWEIDLPA